MEDSDPLGISLMRRFQRVGWTNRRGFRDQLRAFGVYDRCEFARSASVYLTDATYANFFEIADQVALGDCSPRAPTDPDVPTLGHTVPQIMASLRA
jgi:hypothetical protein